jgi:hypothetical protein
MAHDAHDWERQRLGGETNAPRSITEPLISQATGKKIGCVQHDCAKCETDAEERRLLAALLREWYEMFAHCRREGTEGANLIDRTALMLQMTDTLKTANRLT